MKPGCYRQTRQLSLRMTVVISPTMVLCLPALFCVGAAEPAAARPFIWVTDADRTSILAKIDSQPWSRAAFEAMKARVL
jgi:hypothetical protein